MDDGQALAEPRVKPLGQDPCLTQTPRLVGYIQAIGAQK
jgi:hypothetical protein